MHELSNIDLHFLCHEFEELKNARLQNIYEIKDMDGFRFTFHIPERGSQNLIVLFNPKLIFLTSYKYPSPDFPCQFVSFLRKRIKGRRVQRVWQNDLDRILIFDFFDYQLIVELFSKGNLILTDKNQTLMAYRYEKWRDREIKPKKPYNFPKSNKIHPKNLDKNLLLSLQSEHPYINNLIKNINIGSFYMEMIVSDIITKEQRQISPETAQGLHSLFSEFNKFLEGKKTTFIYQPCYTQDEYSVLPLKNATNVETLSEAIDSLFSKNIKQKADSHGDKIKRRLKMQEKSLKEMEKERDECKKIGDFIYSHMNELQTLIESIQKDKNKEGEVTINRQTIKWKKEGKKLILDLNTQ